ncbi:hypothetical protein O7626_08100 [Micromonospora sp. WMMD1102]|uniref:hypothetical protein n=1 Tax=Micromonospora sp. WMMD1102 TaxID=3016105 RepID=UPI0024155C26|nr:hypothetical protein [Micromonospora sp. WMMD1102]MDG4785888.1 hypothetical protein [Micromonospora sp. WMMD1102]
MASKEMVLHLVGQGRGYQEIGAELGIPAGQAYLVGTGLPADGGGTVTRAQRQRPGVLPSRSQALVNPREANPTSSSRVHDWMRERAHADGLGRPGR